MGTKLYVGNLPFNTSEEELKLAFAQCGTVAEVKIISDRDTGRSRGFGFVKMSTEEEARQAIERWNENTFGGRSLVVNEAIDKPRTSSSGGPRRQFSPPPDPDRKGDHRQGRGRRRDHDDYG